MASQDAKKPETENDEGKPLTAEQIRELQKTVPFQEMRRKGDVLPCMQMGKYYMPIWMSLCMDRIAKFPVDPSDVWVCTYPKSGTTWVQHIVWLLVTKDFEGGRNTPIDVRIPEIEIPTPYPPRPENIDEIAKRKPPRLIKSHLPYPMLSKHLANGKVVYVYRNPRDMLVSFFHFYRAWTASRYEGTFDELVDLFVTEKIPYGPWPMHVKHFLGLSRQPNSRVMMVAYEDLKKDRRGWVVKIANFLGIERSDEEIDAIVEATSFDAMKKDNASNYNWLQGDWLDPGKEKFIRKGVVGDWKNYFTDESLAKLETYLKEKMADSGIEFQYH